ncbi:MAG: rRNA methyltransferase, partial [Pseudonocardiales bacterium]|nr:rRNA methyltransferase [Pseudonocardiales bacterium]
GPHEADRVWDRHILNSVAVAELIGDGLRVADIGSGAGLPGIPIAISRPDLPIVLVEPLLRRATFLAEVIDELGLTTVTVARGRAEDVGTRQEHREFDIVTSRAVAALDKLTRWSLPLLRVDGLMLALKGERAQAELDEHRRVMASLGAADARVIQCGVQYLTPPATVVVAQRAKRSPSSRRSSQPSGRRDR